MYEITYEGRRAIIAKHIYTFLSFLFIFSSFVVSHPKTTEANSPFSDVTLYSEQISFLSDQGIISGYKDGTFRPNQPITRLQAVQMILNEMGVEEFSSPDPEFQDIKPGDYGYEYVAEAVERGFIKGRNNGTIFDPFSPLTRGQLAVIMTKAYNLIGNGQVTFTDVPENHWAFEGINALATNEITVGYPDNTFQSNEKIKRAHFSLFLVNYMNKDSSNQLYSLENLYHDTPSFEESVGMIYVYDRNKQLLQQGSGFFIEDGLILTNFHVLQGGVSFLFVAGDGTEYQIEGAAKYDQNYDLAILKTIEEIDIEPLPLSPYSTVNKGERIFAIGSPEGLINTVSDGIVSGLRTHYNDPFETKLIQISAPITFGSSGGPLLDMKGNVIGVTTFGFDSGSLNFAVSVDHIKEWMKELNQISFVDIYASGIPSEDGSFPSTYDPDSLYPGAIETMILELDDKIQKTIVDPNAPIIYGIGYENDIYQINWETKEIKQEKLALAPERLFQRGDELFVALQTGEHSSYWFEEDQTGAIAKYDTATFTKKAQFDINLDPFDLVVDDSHIYVSSGSGQNGSIKSYDKDTGALVDASSATFEKSYLLLDESGNQIYTIDDYHKSYIDVFKISSGEFTSKYMSRNLSTYGPGTDQTLTPDGKYLIDNHGNVFFATNQRETNLTIAAKLGNGYDVIAIDEENEVFYLARQNYLFVYDYNTFEYLQTYYLENKIEQLILDENGYLIALAVNTDTPLPQYHIEKITFTK